MEDVSIYNPANAHSLTAEQLAAMKDFTKEDLKQLAKAFPNTAKGAFLVLEDRTKKAKDQINPLSTWQNLFNLYVQGNTNFFAVGYKSTFVKKKNPLKVAPVQDISEDDAKAELKKAGEQTAKETTGEENKVEAGEEQEAKEIDEFIGKEENLGEKETVGSEDLNEGKPADLQKMNKDELAAEYEKVVGSVPDSKLKKADLIAAIEGKQ